MRNKPLAIVLISMVFHLVATFSSWCDAQQAESPEQTELTPIVVPQLEVDAEEIERLSKAIEKVQNPGELARLHEARAKMHLMQQHWSDAARDYQKAISLQPDNTMHWMRCAIVLRQMPEAAGQYESLAAQMLTQFSETQSPYTAERTAKICSLPLNPVGKQESVEALADLAMGQQARRWGEYFSSTRGIVHYRYGNYEKGIEAAKISERRRVQVGGTDDLAAINYSVQALCLFQLGKTDEARAALVSANKLMSKHFVDPKMFFATDRWHDWLMAKQIYDEAFVAVAAEGTHDDKASTGEEDQPAEKEDEESSKEHTPGAEPNEEANSATAQ